MPRIVECVPNFSEGRRPEVIDQICNEITSVPGIRMLSREMDADHNRSVVTFIGSPEACARAAIASCARAAQLIDLNRHEGEYPRIGATDVIPFVPLRGVTMSECVALARYVAREIGEKLSIPTFLYECAATDPARQNLTNIRGKGYEELRETVGLTPEKTPDYGPKKKLHPTAGGTAVAARDFLITFNAYLNTNDLGIARSIARAVRGSSGGYSFCKAAGFESKERDCVQVAMSLTNPARTPIYRVFEAVKREARRYGVRVTGSEVVGLAPLFAVSETAAYYLQIEHWKPEQIIETAWLEEHTTSGFLEDLASRAPTPGGGSASAYAGALGAALCGMVGRLNDKKTGEPGPLHDTIGPADALLARLNTLMIEDVDSFNAVVASWKLPDDDPSKNARKQEAQIWATRTPLETMAKAIEVMKLAKVGMEASKKSCVSDAGVAAFMAHAALKGARLNVLINLPNIADEKARAEFKSEADRLQAEAEALREEIDKAVEARCA
jgi:glutamate formiminotransferase / formiminotetrahydrofolate cyclodeaminase